MGGSILKRIETIVRLGNDERARRTGAYTVPSISAATIETYRMRIERTGRAADVARLNTSLRSPVVRNLLRLH